MNDSEKAISKYLTEVKRLLPFACKVRKTLLEELRQRIDELNTEGTPITYELLIAEIGTPDEVANSFEDRESIAAFRKRSLRYSKAKVILAVCAILLVVAIVAIVGIITSNDTYHSSTIIHPPTTTTSP